VAPLVVGEDVFEAPTARKIELGALPQEKERLEIALKATQNQITRLQERVAEQAGGESAAILDTHLLLLEDVEMLKKVHSTMEKDQVCAEYAFYTVMLHYADQLRKISDEYIRERTADMEDVARRVVRTLRGDQTCTATADIPHILLLHELTPSAAAALDRQRVLGLITEVGSLTSHAAILARSLGIPAVIGIHDITHSVHTGRFCLLDGYCGSIIFDPTPEQLAAAKTQGEHKARLRTQMAQNNALPAITQDGYRISLAANIEFAQEIASVRANGAEGVGLYRTEFLYLGRRSLPPEEEQFQNYSHVLKCSGEHGVIIRTLDLGGDKLHDLLQGTHEESNPFLGWRGIRVCLSETEIFKTQLRAMLRASTAGHLRIMFPMISGLRELRQAKALLEECRAALLNAGIPVAPNVEVGCMIEVPSAVMVAEMLAAEVDFFSVGTNDLIQYTLAVDRGNDRVAGLYSPCHPAILRMLKATSLAARRAGIWAGVCGEMAGDITLTPLLVALDFGELSMSPVNVPSVKYAIRRLKRQDCLSMLEKALLMQEAEEIAALVCQTARDAYPELLS
jgi:phosphotransferase system enzyme I (PtsI)